jgi:hypothetical protein
VSKKTGLNLDSIDIGVAYIVADLNTFRSVVANGELTADDVDLKQLRQAADTLQVAVNKFAHIWQGGA